MADVAGNHYKAVLKGRGRDKQVNVLVANVGRETAPPTRRSGIHRQDAIREPR